MKVRLGFVSNSSSSSFLVLMKENDYKQMVASFVPLSAAVMDFLAKDEMFCGEKHVKISYVEGNYSWAEDVDTDALLEMAKAIAKERSVELGFEEEEYLDDAYDLIYDGTSDLEKYAKKLKDKAFVHSDYF